MNFKKLHIWVFTFLATGLFTILSCGDKECPDFTNPNCENYDPCHDFVDANADFGMYQICIYDRDTFLFELDTLSWPIFKPKQRSKGLRYEWKVGLDPRTFTKRDLALNFSGFPGKISVRLIVIKDSLDCKSSGHRFRDTLEKSFVYPDPIPYQDFDKTPLAGKYRGYDESNPDIEYTIQLRFDSYNYRIVIDSFPYPCNGNEFGVLPRISAGNTIFCFINPGGRCLPYGYGQLSKDRKELTINYRTQNNSGMDTIRNVFHGIKIE